MKNLCGAAALTFVFGLNGTALADAKKDCYKLKGRPAIAACDQVLRRNPRDAATINNRGVEYEKLGQIDRALEDYNAAVAISSKYTSARRNPKHIAFYYGNRAMVWKIKNEYDRALADFSSAIEVDSKEAEYYNLRCWLRATANRDLPLALTDCDTALAIKPNDANMLDSRGLVYLRLNRSADAIKDYDTGLKISPKSASSLYGRGLAKKMRGDRSEGEADIAEAKAITPDIDQTFRKFGVE